MTATTYNIFTICKLCGGYGYIQVDDGKKNKCLCIKEEEERIGNQLKKAKRILLFIENYSNREH